MSRLSNNTCKNTTGLYVKSLVGNIIPHSWYNKITTSSGRPDRTAILILAEIVYWYRPCKVSSRDTTQSKSSNNNTDKSREGGFKFQDDAWQTSYEHFEKKFSCSKETIRRTFVKLEAYGFISRELRTISKFGQVYNNRLFVHLHTDKLEILLPDPTNFSNEKKICSSLHKLAVPSPQIQGELYKEEEISEKNIDKSRSAKSNFKNEFLENDIPLSVSDNNSILTANNVISPQNKKQILPESKNTAKPLQGFSPLTEELFQDIKSKSGRDFDKNFTDMLLSRIATKYPYKTFFTNKCFINYMSKILACELRNPINTNNESFNFAIPTEARIREDYLNKIEGGMDTSQVSQLKRKIVGKFEQKEAYNILKNLTFDYRESLKSRVLKKQNETSERLYLGAGDISTKIMHIKLAPHAKSSFCLAPMIQAILTQITSEVFGENTNISFVGVKTGREYSKTKQVFSPEESLNTKYTGGQGTDNCMKQGHITKNPYSFDEPNHSQSDTPNIKLEKRVKQLLRKQHGDALYASWFSKLDIERNSKNNQILLKAPTTFMRDWIKTNYSDAIENAILEIAKEAKELLPEIDVMNKRYDLLEWCVC